MFYPILTEREGSEETTDDLMKFINANKHFRKLAQSGFLRTRLTSNLVGEFIDSVWVEPNPKFPSLSKAHLRAEALKKVEILKNYTYEVMIGSASVRVTEYRGYEVISRIFDALSSTKGYLLMPAGVV